MKKMDIKQILQEEVNFHNLEIKRHKNISENSKKQKKKVLKHKYKKQEVIKIVNKLGFKVCECCWGLR